MTADTLNRLAIAAQVWLGTPFFPHGKTPGPDGGCSCQTLAAAVYIEAGVLPEGFEIPVGPIETGFEPMRDALNTWLAKYFAPVESRQAEAGDLMLFKIGRQGHMGISLGNRFIHCLRPAGVKMSRSDDATFLKRLVGVWRPKEVELHWCEICKSYHHNPTAACSCGCCHEVGNRVTDNLKSALAAYVEGHKE